MDSSLAAMTTNDTLIPDFLNGLEPPVQTSKGPAKLFHKKSRNGCQRCRARRVKCNEVHPVCANCQRHQLPCVYDRDHLKRSPPATVNDHSMPHRTPSDHSPSSSSPNSHRKSSVVGPTESTERRVLELKLLHKYLTDTAASLSIDNRVAEIFTKAAPKLAFKNDALLNSIYSVTAVHCAKVDNTHDIDDPIEVHQRYMGLALQQHNNDITHITKDNVDAVCLTSSVMRVCAFVTLSERPLEPYTPPMNWLQMTSTATVVFRAAWPLIGDSETSLAARFLNTMPVLRDREALFGDRNRDGLLHLLARSPHNHLAELWDAEIQDAYESTASFIGGIWKAMNTQESSAIITKRIVSFPMLIQNRFIELVEERQPRALVILAHYFALLSMMRHMWWVEDAGPREVRAIATALPDEWQDLMRWPLQIIDEMIVFK